MVTKTENRARQPDLMVLTLGRDASGGQQIEVQSCHGAARTVPYPDEYPRSFGAGDGIEVWSDDARRIQQLSVAMATQPYVVVTDEEVLIWARGWPPDLCAPEDEPNARVPITMLRVGPVALTLGGFHAGSAVIRTPAQ